MQRRDFLKIAWGAAAITRLGVSSPGAAGDGGRAGLSNRGQNVDGPEEKASLQSPSQDLHGDGAGESGSHLIQVNR